MLLHPHTERGRATLPLSWLAPVGRCWRNVLLAFRVEPLLRSPLIGYKRPPNSRFSNLVGDRFATSWLRPAAVAGATVLSFSCSSRTFAVPRGSSSPAADAKPARRVGSFSKLVGDRGFETNPFVPNEVASAAPITERMHLTAIRPCQSL